MHSMRFREIAGYAAKWNCLRDSGSLLAMFIVTVRDGRGECVGSLTGFCPVPNNSITEYVSSQHACGDFSWIPLLLDSQYNGKRWGGGENLFQQNQFASKTSIIRSSSWKKSRQLNPMNASQTKSLRLKIHINMTKPRKLQASDWQFIPNHLCTKASAQY